MHSTDAQTDDALDTKNGVARSKNYLGFLNGNGKWKIKYVCNFTYKSITNMCVFLLDIKDFSSSLQLRKIAVIFSE